LAALGSAVAIWSGPPALFSPPARLIITGINWLLMGFIAVTSIVPGVSIIGLRHGGQPARGRTAIMWGVEMVALLALWTYLVGLRPA
jgi:hypothetical protein